MNIAYLLTGGNMGDRPENLRLAVRAIEERAGHIQQSSGLYQTAAWGKTDQPDFLNQALCLHTPLDAHQLLHELLTIEKELGRVRLEKYGARLIDIDIIFFNNAIISEPHLKLPHPFMQERRFVLAPMAEIAPKLIHPVLNKTVAELLAICPDKLQVKKFL